MKILKRAWDWYENLWPKPSIEKDMAEKAWAAHLVVQQTRYTILSQAFKEHLALAELDAMEKWRHEVQPRILKQFTKVKPMEVLK